MYTKYTWIIDYNDVWTILPTLTLNFETLTRISYILHIVNSLTETLKGINLLIGLSFERTYLIKGINLMIAKSPKSVDFGVFW